MTADLLAGDMDSLIVKSKVGEFKISFEKNFSFIEEFHKFQYYIIVVGSVVYDFYKNKIFNKFPKEKVIVVKLNEQRKTLATVMKLYKRILQLPGKRKLTLISFGGGVNQDVTGFLSSTIYRGINWIFVPTTLLAMSDSSNGLKTSLNLLPYKNVIGGYYAPAKIYINLDFLKTLKTKDYYSGVGEILKFYLMKKNALKNLDNSVNKINNLKERKDDKLILKIIKESIQIKMLYMLGDEFDQGKRLLLGYGHELGHALEATSHFNIPHGLGVIIGIIFANLVSASKNWITKETYHEINKKLLLPNIRSVNLKRQYFAEKDLLEKMLKDKKRASDKLSLILPKGKSFGLIRINDYGIAEFEKNYAEFLQLLSPYLT